MASQAKTVELWNTLEPAGGTRRAVILDYSILLEENREDGYDTLTLAFPLSLTIASSVANGWAVRVVGEDATLREYLVVVIEDDWNLDTCTLKCGAARTACNGLLADGLLSPTLDSLASTMGSGIMLGQKPGWVTYGTLEESGGIQVTVAGDTFLSACMKIVSAEDALLSSGVAPYVMQFVPTVSGNSITGYTLNIIKTITAGTVHFLQGKNIARFQRRRDTTDPSYPLTGYTIQADDLYRNNAASYPYDNIKPYETCRLEWPSLTIDTQIRIVSVVTDHRNTLDTKVELGTPIRRLQQTVSSLTVTTAPLVSGSGSGITNADVSPTAAIALSKLDLSAGIPDSYLTPTPSSGVGVNNLVSRDAGGGSSFGYVATPSLLVGSTAYNLPGVDGAAGDALRTNGGGSLYWAP